MSGFLIIAFFVLLFTRVSNANANLLDRALLYAFLIVLMSLFGLAVDKVAEILLQVSKTQAAAQVLTPAATVNKVETVEGNIEGSNKEKSAEIGDEVFEEQEEMKAIKKNLRKALKSDE